VVASSGVDAPDGLFLAFLRSRLVRRILNSVYEYKEMLQDAVKPKIEDITIASDEEFKELLGEMQKQKEAQQK